MPGWTCKLLGLVPMCDISHRDPLDISGGLCYVATRHTHYTPAGVTVKRLPSRGVLCYTGVMSSASDQPVFPSCPVRGHDEHALSLNRILTQDGTGAKGYELECPTGRYRFLFLPPVWERMHAMARYSRPRFGWKD